jgi:hypothetical protein
LWLVFVLEKTEHRLRTLLINERTQSRVTRRECASLTSDSPRNVCFYNVFGFMWLSSIIKSGTMRKKKVRQNSQGTALYTSLYKKNL